LVGGVDGSAQFALLAPHIVTLLFAGACFGGLILDVLFEIEVFDASFSTEH